MARTFGGYSPVVPLGVPWEESITLVDENGTAVDLTGYAVRAQLRTAVSLRDADSGAAVDDPVLELTSTGFYDVTPAWPVFEALSIPVPGDGTILAKVETADLWKASPTNEKRKLAWSIVLVDKDTQYAIPVVQGKVCFLPATTQ